MRDVPVRAAHAHGTAPLRSGSGAAISAREFSALEEQIRPQLPTLRARARKILDGDDDAAADAVQEALIALWRMQSVPAQLGGWLLRAVVHRSLHARRTRLRRARWEHGAAEASELCTLCDPEHELEAAEFWACLDRIGATLCAEQRDVWLLRDRDGLEYAEIAQRLDVPLGTVRSRLHRARAQLRARIEDGLADGLPRRGGLEAGERARTGL